MKVSVYKAYDDLPLFLNAETVAKTLGVAPSSAYELMHVVGTSFASLASDQRPKARSLRCASSPHKTRGRFCGDPALDQAQTLRHSGASRGPRRLSAHRHKRQH